MATIAPALPIEPPYDAQRQNNYPLIGDQLGMLYDDIRDGKFGPDAQTGKWFLALKEIRNQFPAPIPDAEPVPPEEPPAA